MLLLLFFFVDLIPMSLVDESLFKIAILGAVCDEKRGNAALGSITRDSAAFVFWVTTD